MAGVRLLQRIISIPRHLGRLSFRLLTSTSLTSSTAAQVVQLVKESEHWKWETAF